MCISKSKSPVIMEVIRLVNYPPVNLNSDENGDPKTGTFAGVQRGRISSQSQKAALRNSDFFRNLDIDYRTRMIPSMVASRLISEYDVPEEYAQSIKEQLARIARKKAKDADSSDESSAEEDDSMDTTAKDKKSSKRGVSKKAGSNDDEDSKGKTQLLMLSAAEFDALVTAVFKMYQKNPSEKNLNLNDLRDQARKIAQENPKRITASMAMMGRMSTKGSDFIPDIDGALSCAHAITTHEVELEEDFFTAHDDAFGLNLVSHDEIQTPTAHLGSRWYNSACYYEFYALDIDTFKKNLNGHNDMKDYLKASIRAFLEAAFYTHPSAGRHKWAGDVTPEVFMVQMRNRKIYTNLVNAYQVPVDSHSNIVEESVKRLTDEVNRTDKKCDVPVVHRAYWAFHYDNIKPEKCDGFDNIRDLIDKCVEWIMEEQLNEAD